MRWRIEWMDGAVSDLQQISQYIERDRDIAAANRVTQAIYDCVQTLQSMPYRGRAGRVAGSRELVVPRLPYIVFYRVLGERVIIIGIAHGAQNLP